MGMLRHTVCLVVLAFGGTGLAQKENPSPASFRPEVTMTVKKHRMGADEVEITLLDANYNQSRLENQIQAIGKALGTAPRGVTIVKESLDPGKPQLSFWKARFAIDGLIRTEEGGLRVDPLLKGFMDGGQPPIQTVQIVFVGVKPSNANVQRFVTAAIEAEGLYSRDPQGLEYRIRIIDQDPESFTFPDKLTERSEAQPPSKGPSGLSPMVLGIIALAGVSAGVLVYSLIRGGGRPRAR